MIKYNLLFVSYNTFIQLIFNNVLSQNKYRSINHSITLIILWFI